jgi:hypothetical protein
MPDDEFPEAGMSGEMSVFGATGLSFADKAALYCLPTDCSHPVAGIPVPVHFYVSMDWVMGCFLKSTWENYDGDIRQSLKIFHRHKELSGLIQMDRFDPTKEFMVSIWYEGKVPVSGGSCSMMTSS